MDKRVKSNVRRGLRLNSKIAKFKVAYLAVGSGLNVVQACKRAKISRSIYYKYKKRTESLGIEKVTPHRSRPNNFRTYDVKLRKLIRQVAIENPQFSSGKISEHLNHKFQKTVSRSGVKNHLVASKLYQKEERREYLENFYRGNFSAATTNQISFLSKYDSEIIDIKTLKKTSGQFVQLKTFKVKDSDGNNRNIYLCIDARTKLAAIELRDVYKDLEGTKLSDVLNANMLWEVMTGVLKRLNGYRLDKLSVHTNNRMKDQFQTLFVRKKHQLNLGQQLIKKDCFLDVGGAAIKFQSELEQHFSVEPASMVEFVKSANKFTTLWNRNAVTKLSSNSGN